MTASSRPRVKAKCGIPHFPFYVTAALMLRREGKGLVLATPSRWTSHNKRHFMLGYPSQTKEV
jgi:hypothetical protein